MDRPRKDVAEVFEQWNDWVEAFMALNGESSLPKRGQ